MIIIGISGKMGSGKTTAASYLFPDEDKVILNLDHILDDVKKKILKRSIEEEKRSTGETVLAVNKQGYFYKTANSKYINKIYKTLRNTFVKRIIDSKLLEAETINKKYFIIEGVQLEDYKILDILDFSILIYCSDEIRHQRVKRRQCKVEKTFMKKEVIKDKNKYF